MKKREQELQEIDFNEEAFMQLSGQFEEAQAKLEAEKTSVAKLSRELEVVTRELDVKQEQLAGFKQAEEELINHF